MRLIRFVLTGGLNTAFGYACYAFLVLAGLPLWLAVAGSTVIGVVFNFYSYGGLVFSETSPRFLPRFIGFYAALGLVNYGLLRLLATLGLGPLVSQALLLPVMAGLAYLGMRNFVFVPRDRQAEVSP